MRTLVWWLSLLVVLCAAPAFAQSISSEEDLDRIDDQDWLLTFVQRPQPHMRFSKTHDELQSLRGHAMLRLRGPHLLAAMNISDGTLPRRSALQHLTDPELLQVTLDELDRLQAGTLRSRSHAVFEDVPDLVDDPAILETLALSVPDSRVAWGAATRLHMLGATESLKRLAHNDVSAPARSAGKRYLPFATAYGPLIGKLVGGTLALALLWLAGGLLGEDRRTAAFVGGAIVCIALLGLTQSVAELRQAQVQQGWPSMNARYTSTQGVDSMWKVTHYPSGKTEQGSLLHHYCYGDPKTMICTNYSDVRAFKTPGVSTAWNGHAGNIEERVVVGGWEIGQLFSVHVNPEDAMVIAQDPHADGRGARNRSVGSALALLVSVLATLWMVRPESHSG